MKDECTAWSGAVVSNQHCDGFKPGMRIKIRDFKPGFVIIAGFLEKYVVITAVHKGLRAQCQRKISIHSGERKRYRTA
jgi:hypothetical protein